MIQFKATFHKLSMDNEGESTLILKIPLSDAQNALLMASYLQEVVEVKVWKESENIS